MSEESKPIGRPKLKLEDLPQNWQSELPAMGEQGCSDVELRNYLNGICHETWERLIKEEPQFSETVKIARLKCQVFWEKQGRINLSDKDFSPTLWYMNMKNRFGWSDKKEIKQTGTPPNIQLNVIPNKTASEDNTSAS